MKKSASFGAVGQDAPTTSNEWNIRSHASIYLVLSWNTGFILVQSVL